MKLKIAPTILLIVITILFSLKLAAQPTAGFQAGFNLASLNGHKDYDENKPRIGLTANLLVDVPLSRNGFISIESGIGISQQGMRHTKIEEAITNGIATKATTEIKNKLDYLVVPLYLKENFQNAYTKFGVYGGYLLNVKSDYSKIVEQSGIAGDTETGSNEDFVENANVYDYGLSFGFGFINYLNQGRRRFHRRRGRRTVPVLQVDFKYNIGLAPIDAAGNTPNMNFKNRVFMIGLTISSVPNK
jgi:hypothetical protein